MTVRGICVFLAWASLAAAAPAVTSLSPNVIDAGGPYFQLTITGIGFVPSSSASLSGAPLDTFYVSATQLQAAITPELRTLSGRFDLTVTNPGASPSNASPLLISPVIGAVNPNTALTGASATSITVTGIGFIARDIVILTAPGRQTKLATTFVNSTRLTALIPAAALASSADAVLTVADSLYGAASTTLPFTIQTLPSILAVAPNRIDAGGPYFLLTLTGIGLVPSAVVNLGTEALVTTYISPTQLQAAVTPELRALSGTFNLSVTLPGGLTTTVPYPLRIAPVLSAVSPTSATVGSAAFPVAATGIGFTRLNQIQFTAAGQTLRLVTSFTSSTSLSATLPAGMLTNPGTAALQIINTVGPDTSDTIPFPILAAPRITYASPNPMDAGGPALVMTLLGSGIEPGSLVSWAGAVQSTAIAVSDKVTFPITLEMRALSGSIPITVTGPAGGVSAPYIAVISPVLLSIAPTTTPAQSGPALLTATGIGFTRNNAIVFNGAGMPTTYTNSTTLMATIPAAALLSPGRAGVQIADTLGSGRSLELPFPITEATPRPAITSLTPSAAPAGTPALTLVIAGFNFGAASVARWDKVPLATTFVSATRLTATAPASLLSAAGAVSLTILNPDGTTSDAAPFLVSVNTPSLTALSPASAAAGSPPFALTVYGFNFAPGAVIEWNGVPLATTLISPTQLTATITVSPAAASIPVTVSNPGGLTSRAATFAVTPAALLSSVLAVSNAFRSLPSAAPGSLLSIYGNGLATPVTINGVRTPILYASDTQINAQVPFEIRPGPATLIVEGCPPVPLEVAATAPAILTAGAADAVAQDVSGGLITAASPVAPGATATVYLTGQGLLDHPIATGAAASADPLLRPLAEVQATLAGQPAIVSFAGLAPGFIGLLQVNLVIPEVAAGSQPLAITIGGISANAAVLPIR